MLNRTRRALGVALALSAALAALPSSAADAYPGRAIKIVVPFPAGGPGDAIARVAADALKEELKQTVVIENMPGAGGTLGPRSVASAKPDGYTLLATSASSHAVAPAVSKSLPYDPVKDFTPVSMLGNTVFVVVVNPMVPARTLSELVAVAKAKPTVLNYPSSGNGSLIHLAGLQFQSLTGTKLTHVPYKGAQPAMIDLVSGVLQMQFADLGGVMPFIKSGQVRPLAVVAPKRLPELPDVPTVAEAGLPGLSIPGWFALFAPAGTPKPMLDLLTRATGSGMHRPEAQSRLRGIGVEVVTTDGPTLATRVEEDTKHMTDLVRRAGLRTTE